MTPDTFQSAYRQALATLDAQLARLNREVTTLAAAHPADPDVIASAAARARQAAEAVTAAMNEAAAAAGDPPPLWGGREELDAAAARLVEKLKASAGNARRTRLRAIAGALLVAQVLHPRWKKVVPALDALRLKAAAQLHEAAAVPDPPDLPGPADGGAWLAWAWELPMQEVEQALASVRASVPALVAVVLEIDPGHWVVTPEAEAEAVAEAVAEAEAVAVPDAAAVPRGDSLSDVLMAQVALPPSAEGASSILSDGDAVPIADAVSSGTVLPSESWIGANSAPGLRPLSGTDDSSVLPGPPRMKPRNTLPDLPKPDPFKDKK
ncbi:hypothetical protein [Gemmata sp.]|uniref:hypothetical protein n=1 Tax=Gemmata sp. TaxID=1914242 RepID=UPI003F6F6D6F